MGRFDLAMGRKSTNKYAIRGVDVREVRFLMADDKGGPPVHVVPIDTAFNEAGQLKRAGIGADDCFEWLSTALGSTMDTGRWHAYLKNLFENNNSEDLLASLWNENASDIQAAQRVFGDIGNPDVAQNRHPRLTSEEVVHEMLQIQGAPAEPETRVTSTNSIEQEEDRRIMAAMDAAAVTPAPQNETESLLDAIFDGSEPSDEPEPSAPNVTLRMSENMSRLGEVDDPDGIPGTPTRDLLDELFEDEEPPNVSEGAGGVHG